jgi:hypothetical protein
MFRRRGQRMFGGMGKPDVPPMLQRANQLMAAGDYAGAAVAYKELAQRAENRFGKRAPFLFIQAGRAAILSGQTKTGVADLRHGLTIFASQGRFPRMRAFGQLAIEDLNSRNLNAEAEEIASLLKASLPKGFQAENSALTKKPALPTHCPSCGAAVRPDEVEWLDDITAECDYCGSPVRGE